MTSTASSHNNSSGPAITPG